MQVLHKTIYELGILFRNKKINRNLAFLQESELWSRKKLITYQNTKLRNLISIAYNECPYYKELFDHQGLKPNNINSIKDLEKIPYTSKATLLENRANIQTSIKAERSYYSETSGSTGEPLIFYRNQDWDAWHNASVIRGYSWHGVKPWDRNGYLWGYNLSKKEIFKTKILDALQNRFRLFSYCDEEIADFCHKLKDAKYLNGYSSMIYELAKYIDQNEELKNNINLAFIKGTSEKIYETYQEKSKKVFGKKIISEYGAAEAGIIAFECQDGNMHINMETVIVEEIDSRIIVTNLVSKSFPIIRYELGDYIELDMENMCSCGRASYIIKEVTGRIGQSIRGIHNAYPSLTLYYIFKNIAINHSITLNYQVIQKEKGYLTFRIEQKLTDRDLLLIEKEIKKYFNDDLHYEILGGQNLSTKDGKTKDFISLLE